MSRRSFSGLVEVMPGFEARPEITDVIFDFDGTLSLIRQGWPEVMTPMFVEMLPPRSGESEQERWQLAWDDIMRLNGKQTIYQMIQLAERIRERGGRPRDPLWYKKEYLRRLDIKVAHRREALRARIEQPERYLVHGARTLLDLLADGQFRLYLASGTDEVCVKEEADLLDLTRYFGSQIFGALDEYKMFSKKMVIERILREHRISGATLIGFGDGYVEIENIKAVGGLAVAVASDEANNGSGKMDAWKRERLTGVGADVVVPDFRDAHALLDLIHGRLPLHEITPATA